MARIIGTPGDDLLEQGTEGDDIFFGAGGYDEIHTFGGNDTVVIETRNDIDYIADFDPAHDRIVFNGFPNLTSIEEVLPFISIDDAGTPRISLPDTGVGVLFNTPIQASDINADTVAFNRNLDPNHLGLPPNRDDDVIVTRFDPNGLPPRPSLTPVDDTPIPPESGCTPIYLDTPWGPIFIDCKIMGIPEPV